MGWSLIRVQTETSLCSTALSRSFLRPSKMCIRDRALADFRSRYQVTEWAGEDREAFYAKHLPGTDILISQQEMGADRLALAPGLRAIFNVETNFLPNIDYEECFRRGVHVFHAHSYKPSHDGRVKPIFGKMSPNPGVPHEHR